MSSSSNPLEAQWAALASRFQPGWSFSGGGHQELRGRVLSWVSRADRAVEGWLRPRGIRRHPGQLVEGHVQDRQSWQCPSQLGRLLSLLWARFRPPAAAVSRLPAGAGQLASPRNSPVRWGRFYHGCHGEVPRGFSPRWRMAVSACKV